MLTFFLSSRIRVVKSFVIFQRDETMKMTCEGIRGKRFLFPIDRIRISHY